MKRCRVLIALVVVATSCYQPVGYNLENVVGYRPVYSTDPQLKRVAFIQGKAMSSPGKIYAKDSLILQNDVGAGIHVYDTSRRSGLRKLGFINIPGNVELSIRGNYLYANSFDDLVVIDIADVKNPKEINRVGNAFNSLGGQLWAHSFIPMPEKDMYYECVDYDKGTHVGWEKDTLTSACYFFNYSPQ